MILIVPYLGCMHASNLETPSPMALLDCQLMPAHLLLSKTNSLLHRNSELPREIFIRLVVRQVQSVETTSHVSQCETSWWRIIRRPYHVWDLGKALSDPDFSIVNLLGPSLPCRSLNPLTGIREVPVANCNNLDFCSASQLLMHCLKPISAEVLDGGHRLLTVQKFLMT